MHKLDRGLAIACGAILALTILYPTVRLLVSALDQWEGSALLGGQGLRATLNTVFISFASVAASGVVGTLMALAVTRYTFPGSRLLAVLAYLPFTLPPLVGVLSFYYLIGRDGLFPRLLHSLGYEGAGVPGVWAILAIHTYSFYVFFYAMLAPALASLDRSQVEAARTLGAGPLRAFFLVTLPLLRPALVGASLLTFMSSGASFSAPYFFGSDFPMLSVVIFNARSEFQHGTALTLTIVLACVSLLGLLLFRTRQKVVGTASKGAPAPVRSVGGRVLAGLGAWCCILLLLLPHLNILALAFADHRAWHTELLPTRFTLDNFSAIFGSARNLGPIWNSVWMSGVATAGVFVVGVPLAYLIGRRRPWGRLLNTLVMIPWALPGTVIAINLIVAFNDPWLPVYNTVWMLPLAYFVRSVPLVTRVAGAAIESFDATLIEAAQTLGASHWRSMRVIVAPMLAPAIAAGLALVFATSLGEFVASILLYLPGNLPISVKINMEWRTSVGVAFAYSTLLMMLVAVTFYLSRRFGAQER